MNNKDVSGLRIDQSKKIDSRGRGPAGWIVVLSLLLGAGGLAFGVYSYLRPPAASSQPVPSEALADARPAASGSGPQTGDVLIASGYVVAHHKIQLGSKVMGKVAWIGVEKGDRVRKGQLLVKLEDREYRARVEEARSTLDAANSRLQELEAGFRPEEIERGRAEVLRSRADTENARLELGRLQSLLQSGVISEKQVDDARTRLEMAEAAQRVTEHNFDLLELGPRSEQIEQARAEVGRSQASLEYNLALLDATEIRAPTDGTVLERIAEMGEMVTTSFAGEMGAKSAVVSLADLNDLQVELDISQSDFNRVSDQLGCRMAPDAFPDRRYECRIDEISPEANRQKATIQVKVKVLNPDEFLRPEMTAQVTFFRPEASASTRGM